MPDRRLVQRLHRLVDRGNALTAELLAHMGEIDRRRLYLEAACPSMFVYCTDVLKMSEGQTYKRIRAARLAREFPAVLPMVQDGRIHLCALGLLASHMTEDTGGELLLQAVHKSKRQVQKLLASLFPSPPVPDKVRKLPGRRAEPGHGADAVTPAAEPLLKHRPTLASAQPAAPAMKPAPAAAQPAAEPSVPRAPKRGGRSTPLSTDTYKIEFTAGEPLHEKLGQARELLRHRVPDGDLATVFERALDALLPRLRKERFAEVSNPRKPGKRSAERSPQNELPRHACGEERTCEGSDPADEPAPVTRTSSDTAGAKRSRHIPAEVKRQVAERDGHRCTYTDATGRRCQERGLVQFHHVHPFGKDGAHEVDNLTLRCRAHNAEAARHDYGEQVMERWRDRGEGASAPTVPGDSWPPPGTAAKDGAASHRKARDTG